MSRDKKKIDEKSYYWWRKSSYLKKVKNFNGIFRKFVNVTYDNIKTKKKKGLILPLKNAFLQKPEDEWQTEPPSFLRVKILI